MEKSKTSGKPGRVKVGVRCRPPFQDEIEFAKGEFISIIDTVPETTTRLGQISLTLVTGKQRDFQYDYVFDQDSNQDSVYDRIARPVVTDVLKGYNGTIFAYGQTGTGKTYTMGILEFVNNEHAGIIPRAMSQIFEFMESSSTAEVTVSLSFLQLYRETIQDLLSPASGNDNDNLAIREDPNRGFFVEGLQEFVVRNYREAEALVNLGLENRAIAPTLMNSTSSRSHTILTLNIEQRVVGDAKSFSRTVRSKLLMVDLAGSERVRRTVSKGTRLSEAKSINTSLSALGNVIAALAEQNTTHIPYRDSKLTRLLQDSLGGTASTALIATIGPAAVNYGETLSTLLFASRCMAVKITPITHEEVDYAEMCAKLQAKVNAMEGEMTAKLLEQQQTHDAAIKELRERLEMEASKSLQQEFNTALLTTQASRQAFDNELNGMLDRLERIQDEDGGSPSRMKSWLNKPVGWTPSDDADETVIADKQLVILLGYCYEIIAYMSAELGAIMDANQDRTVTEKAQFRKELNAAHANEEIRQVELQRMEAEDPRGSDTAKRPGSANSKASDTEEVKIGSHLAPMSRVEAMVRVEQDYPSNNEPVTNYDHTVLSQPIKANARPVMYNCQDIGEVAEAIASMHNAIRLNFASVTASMARKDMHFKRAKQELASQLIEKRRREEEVVNWSYILKYLLSSTSKLRREVKQARSTKKVILGAGGVPAADDRSVASTALTGESSKLLFHFGKAFLGEQGSVSDSRAGKLNSIFQSVDHENGGTEDRAPVAAEPVGKARSDAIQMSAAVGSVSMRLQDPPTLGPRVVNSQPPPAPPVRTVKDDEGLQGATLSQDRMRHHNEMYGRRQQDAGMRPAPQQLQAGRDYGAGLRRRYDYDDEDEAGYDGAMESPAHSGRGGVTPTEMYVEVGRSYAYSVDDSDLTVTSTNRSVRSSPSGVGFSYDNAVDQFRQQRPSTERFTPAIPRRQIGGGATPATLQSRQPSEYAREVASSLGVVGSQASAAMGVIDRVAQITDEQLRQLDPETREQILQIRRDLKLDKTRSQGPPAAPQRSLSTPKARISSATASSLSQMNFNNPSSLQRSNSGSANPMMKVPSMEPAQKTPRVVPSSTVQSVPLSASRSASNASLNRGLGNGTDEESLPPPPPPPLRKTADPRIDQRPGSGYRADSSRNSNSRYSNSRHSSRRDLEDSDEDDDDDNFSQLDNFDV